VKAEIVEGWPKENSIRIALSETDASQVNAIRRALISDVPKLAITRVNISQGVVENEGQILESVNVLPDILPVKSNISEAPFLSLLILSHAFLANIS